MSGMSNENETPTLVRTRGGSMIHVSTCSTIKRAKQVEWKWAAGKTAAQILGVAWITEFAFCYRCDPLEVLKRVEQLEPRR